MPGLFVTFEGVDRAGKTTQARMLAEALGKRALAVREPGGTAIGERIRALVKDGAVERTPWTEALLFAAARAELVETVIRPALEEGLVVVSDRYVDSSLAYQGAGRGLPVEEVAEVNRVATHGLTPDVTFLLELPLESASERGGEVDHFESEGRRLQEHVRDAYSRLADADRARWQRIDAARPADVVHAEVLAAVERALGTVTA